MKENLQFNAAQDNRRGKSLLGAHEVECQKFFDEIKNGEKIYIRVDQPFPTEDATYTRISLLSDGILNYDGRMLQPENRERLLEVYRPYFVSFTVPLEDNRSSDLENLGDGWHLGHFIPSEDAVNAQRERGRYLDILAEYGESDPLVLTGILTTSASPVSYLDGKLLVFKNAAISPTVLDQINGIYDPHKFLSADNVDIENILNAAWRNDLPETIDIYNVGHGNADYIRGTHHRILYDIGYDYRSTPRQHLGKFQKAAVAIRHLKPSCVILSHWDLDHMIGCAYAQQDIFKVKWIAPSLVSKRDKTPTINSVRLAQYLNILGNLYLVDRDQSTELIARVPCFNGVELRIWLGHGTGMLTPKNREGLFVEIMDDYGRYPHILLAGDVPYRSMPNYILKAPIDFMHVPHHCSKMELANLRSIPGTGTCAIISTNRTRCGRLNCRCCHYDELKKKYKHVLATIEHPSGNDSANLSVEISYNTLGGAFRLR